jgi:hypothetical protein
MPCLLQIADDLGKTAMLALPTDPFTRPSSDCAPRMYHLAMSYIQNGIQQSGAAPEQAFEKKRES